MDAARRHTRLNTQASSSARQRLSGSARRPDRLGFDPYCGACRSRSFAHWAVPRYWKTISRRPQGSAGESIAAGIAFTIPALLVLGYDLEISRTTMIALLGGWLGVLLMIPLQARFDRQRARQAFVSGGDGVRRKFWSSAKREARMPSWFSRASASRRSTDF